jgi:hypothetical protein
MKLERAATKKAFNTTFYVHNDSQTERYVVHHKWHPVKHRKVWTCDCKNFTEEKIFTGGTCKHIDFVIISLDQPVPVTNNVLSGGYNRGLAASFRSLPDPTPATPEQTAKSVLEQVVAVLNNRDTISGLEESNRLWSILTALRGPDQKYSYDLKNATTARIRHAIGLKGTDRFTTRGATPITLADLNQRFPKADGHFFNHYDVALTALSFLGYLK